MTANPLVLDGSALSPADVEGVALDGRTVEVSESALDSLRASRAVIDDAVADGRAYYGINTGFGSLARTRIPDTELSELQRNLLRSHSAGIGEPLPTPIVRAMLLLLTASLCRGRSGVRPEVPRRIADLLNHGVTPIVPSVGSVGASGDLAPLSHACLVLIGEGEAEYQGERLEGGEALRRAGLKAIELQAKEGLALINGTHLMAAEAALLARQFDRLFNAAVLACAMSIDASKGSDSFLDERAYEARNQPGPARVGAMLRACLHDSAIIPSHKEGDPRVQDPYSLRCAAYVLGAAWDAARYVKLALEHELGAVSDNPLVFADGAGGSRIVSAGNFHGMPIALPLDTLATALSQIAGISERRTFLLLAARDPEMGLPAYLTPEPGVQSGLMIAQYTAAACVNEMIGLAMPATVSNLSTSAGMEDYNSFGPRSAAKARRSMDLARHVVAVELICAGEALDHHRPLKSGAIVEQAHETLRPVVARLVADRPPGPDIERVAGLIRDGALPTIPVE